MWHHKCTVSTVVLRGRQPRSTLCLFVCNAEQCCLVETWIGHFIITLRVLQTKLVVWAPCSPEEHNMLAPEPTDTMKWFSVLSSWMLLSTGSSVKLITLFTFTFAQYIPASLCPRFLPSCCENRNTCTFPACFLSFERWCWHQSRHKTKNLVHQCHFL